MKRLLFTAFLAVSLVSSSFASGTNKVNSLVLDNFKSEFAGASDIRWTSSSSYAKADFTLNNKRVTAFYNTKAELIGTSENIGIEKLPLNAKKSFAKKFDGYTVKEVIRFDGAEEAAYYISAESGKESVILRVADGEDLSIYKRVKK